MGCKFSKTNKVLPVVQPIRAWEAISPPNNPKTKKDLGKGRCGKKTPPVTRDAPPATNNAASSVRTDPIPLLFVVVKAKAGRATNESESLHPSPQAESTQANKSLNLHPFGVKEQSVDYVPIHLVKEADACNQKVTPSILREILGTLINKQCSEGSFKSDQISASNTDSGISLTAGENDECTNVITERSSSENLEIAKVSYCLASYLNTS